jgi:thiol-disulfide isomerase/thioredoxin
VPLAGILLVAACGTGGQATDGLSPAATDPAAAGSAAPAAGGSATPAGGAVPGGAAGSAGAGAGAGAVAAPLAFDAQTTDGRTLSGTSLAGRPAVFWFWAPWCTICHGEAPEIARMHERFGDRVQFVGVAGLGQVAEMRDFVDDTRLGAFPHLVDADGGLWARFGVPAQPAFAFVTAGGELDVELGELPEADLASRLDGLSRT